MKKLRVVNKDNIIIPEGEMTDFNRPDHPDFMSSSELRAINFSGQRVNSITGNWELWIMGEVAKEVTVAQVKSDPQIINKAVEDAFGLHEVQPDMVELHRFRGTKK